MSNPDDPKPLVAQFPDECEAVVVAAQMWLHSHPDAGPGYERLHETVTAELKGAVRALNRADNAAILASVTKS